jgi:hypothetical protein
MPKLATKGIAKKTFSSARDAIEWAEKQYLNKSKEDQEELARFRLMANNVPKDFWSDKYSKVEAHFDPDGAVDYFGAYDDEGDQVRRY